MNKTILSWMLAVLAATMLAACGGGGTSTSTTPTATATSAGTVTGFGSVIVDGERIDDSKARVETENPDGSMSLAELKLGQSVRVQYDGNMSASHVRIDPSLVGSVTAVDLPALSLTVAGQTVVVNTDPAAGPVTVFDAPYTSLADVQVGDLVEVHGLPVFDSATGTYTVQATRIEKKSTPVAYFRLAGLVQGLDTTAKVFTLGNLTIDYTNATVRPDVAALADGKHVRIWVDVSTPISTTNSVPAKFVSIDERNKPNAIEARVGGTISKWDATAKTFEVNGIKVDATTAKLLPASRSFADLADGVYVRVRGNFATDGTLVATSIVLRKFEFDFSVELHGTITDYVSDADFKVRGVPVDASSATIDLTRCPTGTTALGDGLFVEVEGNIASGPKLVATKVKCDDMSPGVSVIERRGVAGQVDLSAKTFVLTPSGTMGSSSSSGSGTPSGPITVHWTDTTFFKGVDAATLDTKTVQVVGVYDTTAQMLTAIAIKLR